MKDFHVEKKRIDRVTHLREDLSSIEIISCKRCFTYLCIGTEFSDQVAPKIRMFSLLLRICCPLLRKLPFLPEGGTVSPKNNMKCIRCVKPIRCIKTIVTNCSLVNLVDNASTKPTAVGTGNCLFFHYEFGLPDLRFQFVTF